MFSGRVDIRTALDEAKLQYGDMLDKDDSLSLNLFINQAKHAMTHNKPENALSFLNQAAAIQNNNEVRITRGKCLLKVRLYEEACDDAEEVLKIEPKHAEALLIKAEGKYHIGNFENALVCYHRGKFVARKNMLASFVHGVRRTEEAIAEYLDKKTEELFQYPNPAFFDKNILCESYSNLRRYLPKEKNLNLS